MITRVLDPSEATSGNWVFLILGLLFVAGGVALIIQRRRAVKFITSQERTMSSRFAALIAKRVNPNGNIFIFIGIVWMLVGGALSAIGFARLL